MNRWTVDREATGMMGLSGFVVIGLLLLSCPVNGEELRKFQLPSQKNAPVIRKMQEPLVYRRFRDDAQSWPLKKKNAMISSLEQKVDQARKDREFSQIQHYSKLIQILQDR